MLPLGLENEIDIDLGSYLVGASPPAGPDPEHGAIDLGGADLVRSIVYDVKLERQAHGLRDAGNGRRSERGVILAGTAANAAVTERRCPYGSKRSAPLSIPFRYAQRSHRATGQSGPRWVLRLRGRPAANRLGRGFDCKGCDRNLAVRSRR